MYHSGTNLGFYIIYEHMPIIYLALGLFCMNVLTLWSLDTETKVVIVAFLWYPFSIVCLRLLLLFIACVLLTHIVWLRILAILHSLIHSIELHLVVIVIIVASSIVVVTVVHIEVLVRTLSHYLLRKIELYHLLIYQLSYKEILLSHRSLLLLLINLLLLLCWCWDLNSRLRRLLLWGVLRNKRDRKHRVPRELLRCSRKLRWLMRWPKDLICWRVCLSLVILSYEWVRLLHERGSTANGGKLGRCLSRLKLLLLRLSSRRLKCITIDVHFNKCR